MTVSVLTHVQQRPWRGYEDPGLPVGMYISQNAVTGDASGGDMVVIFVFRGEGSAASGRFYNIEQVDAHHSVASTRPFALKATNWDLTGPAGLVNREWTAELTDNSNGVSAMNTIRQFPLPIFLGITAPVASLAAQLEFSVNNVDVTSLVVTVQGYIWEPRSVLTEGGLRRPVDSLYGAGRQ